MIELQAVYRVTCDVQVEGCRRSILIVSGERNAHAAFAHFRATTRRGRDWHSYSLNSGQITYCCPSCWTRAR